MRLPDLSRLGPVPLDPPAERVGRPADGFPAALDRASLDRARTPGSVARTQVATLSTPLSGGQAAAALEHAWQARFERPPSAATLAVLTAHWAHETGGGRSMRNFNFGGIKGTSPEGMRTAYVTHEGFGSSRTELTDSFRAYSSADAGARDYLSLLERRYPEAIAAAERGDSRSFSRALKGGGYYTDSEATYSRRLEQLSQQALAAGYDALGRGQASAALVPTAASEPSPRDALALALELVGEAADPQLSVVDWSDALRSQELSALWNARTVTAPPRTRR